MTVTNFKFYIGIRGCLITKYTVNTQRIGSMHIIWSVWSGSAYFAYRKGYPCSPYSFTAGAEPGVPMARGLIGQKDFDQRIVKTSSFNWNHNQGF